MTSSHEHHLSQELENLKDKLEDATKRKQTYEARLEVLKEQERLLLDKMNAMGLTPETLPQEIERLEEEINRLMREAKELLPREDPHV